MRRKVGFAHDCVHMPTNSMSVEYIRQRMKLHG